MCSSLEVKGSRKDLKKNMILTFPLLQYFYVIRPNFKRQTEKPPVRQVSSRHINGNLFTWLVKVSRINQKQTLVS